MHLSPPPNVKDNPAQAAQRHILSVQVGSFNHKTKITNDR